MQDKGGSGRAGVGTVRHGDSITFPGSSDNTVET